MKPIHHYYKPYYVWIQKTKTNTSIIDLSQNEILKHTNHLNNNFQTLGSYLTLSKYYNYK